VVPAVGAEFVGGRLLSRCQLDEGGDHLTPLLVGNADDRRLLDGRVGEQ
jgi:hypothetical protein